ncbi:glutaredoxin [Marinitoga sp. 1135]|uniref:Glutaredoxin-like domain protein n=1 Tax=Marinitoga piezophila (strain DSM 14283 / JCM 11233 / KA3) TaxID=443254 RepID=H2J559_MARPK|nr:MULTISPECIES: thioredoxin family protein [Marinitoga]AEX86076.1 Glutaredoxin-like domain protein [Marinitoga piezophila KA3]APT76494.1 glutaredoxin [Marinitoga sp. 1137]NUU96263.1 glutaredoxin [Marinitoga sp. 1135]NUU98182.1 glutaredoxin [Marinitoga sp. 1138]
MERLLDDKTLEQVKDLLGEMKGRVKIILFEKDDCEYCEVTKQLYTELSEGVDNVDLEVENIDSPLAEEYEIDKTLAPATVILASNGSDLGVRFYGIPSGHEFSTLLQDLILMSKNGEEVDFSEDTIEKLKGINKKIRLRVFVTPTCPYCPRAVLSAQMAAMINENINGEMVEANEFYEISMKHNVSSVPHTVIEAFENGEWVVKGEFIGAYPEPNFVEEVLKAVEG